MDKRHNSLSHWVPFLICFTRDIEKEAGIYLFGVDDTYGLEPVNGI
ncbi:hypothetical protein [Vibrio metschnikovii]|nr:hypothetical protein [Vibrio metschnikovii]